MVLTGKVGRPTIQLKKLEIIAHFHLPQPLAARLLGVSVSGLKRECRKLGIPQWPYKRCSIRSTIDANCSNSLDMSSGYELEIEAPDGKRSHDSRCAVPLEAVHIPSACSFSKNMADMASHVWRGSTESNLHDRARDLVFKDSIVLQAEDIAPSCFAMPCPHVRPDHSPTWAVEDSESDSENHGERLPEDMGPETSALVNPVPAPSPPATSWPDQIEFLLSVPATADLTEDTDFIEMVEAQDRDGYLERHAADATSFLTRFPADSWHATSKRLF
jgi:hypothetical protein